jgi:hypothetical protein
MSVSYFKTSAQASFTASAVTVGPIEWEAPFDGSTEKVLFRQKYQQDIDSWSAISISSAYAGTSLTNFVLVRESDFQAIGGGQHQWNRYYAITPSQRIEYTSYAGQFPGYQFVRDPLNATTPARLTFDYFLINSSTDIPVIYGPSVVAFATGETAPLLSGVYLKYNTFPSAVSYSELVSADAVSYGQFSITAEAQSLSRWQGNFYERKTMHTKAR